MLHIWAVRSLRRDLECLPAKEYHSHQPQKKSWLSVSDPMGMKPDSRYANLNTALLFMKEIRCGTELKRPGSFSASSSSPSLVSAFGQAAARTLDSAFLALKLELNFHGLRTLHYRSLLRFAVNAAGLSGGTTTTHSIWRPRPGYRTLLQGRQQRKGPCTTILPRLETTELAWLGSRSSQDTFKVSQHSKHPWVDLRPRNN